MAEHVTLTTTPLPEAPPTVTHYQRLAGETITAIDQIMGVIPKVDEAEASGRKIAGSRTGVPEAFIAAAIAAVEQLVELASANKFDPVAARDKIQCIEAIQPLYDKMFMATGRLHFLLLWLKDSLGAESLQILRVAKQYASDGRSPLMAAHVAIMQRALGKRVQTKAQREERKLARMMEAFAEMQRAQTQEVQKAA